MSAPAGTSPEETVSSLFQAFDALDIERAEALFADDVQGVDELSGGWRRGRDALHEYLQMISSAGLSDVRSSLSDVHTTDWGDTSVLTAVLDQSYRMGAEAVSLHAPTTIVLRRQEGAWRIALVHSVPLPESETA
ncbi:MAG: hypothetical protein QOH46_2356 [Solirubrobacteraceae bacterium]|jgi:uncharacterized protein (TIGR02246 family)|nr:hypothetical protein [Solirubrobacteraceae bacterium]